MSEAAPTPNGGQTASDRDARGRFAPGNSGGPGNPAAADVSRHRQRFFAALRDNDTEQALRVIRRLMKSKGSKDADRLAAARELLDRVLGKAVASDLLDRIEALEATVNRQEAGR